MKCFGFKFKSIKYNKNYKRNINKNNKKVLYKFIYQTIITTHNNIVVFIDESSICQSNFQNKIWTLKKNSDRNIISKIKYERIMIVAGISFECVENLMILESNFNKKIFNYFILNILSKVYRRTNYLKQIIIVMDNASTHKNSQLIKICQKLKVGIVFTIPGQPKANAIEYYWQYIKQDFKQMITYNR